MAADAYELALQEARSRLQTIVDEQIGPHPEMGLDELISELEAALWTWRNRCLRAETEEGIAKRTLDAYCAGHWHPIGDGAHAAPFGCIRKCNSCGCLVAGGPTACGRCVAKEEAKDAPR